MVFSLFFFLIDEEKKEGRVRGMCGNLVQTFGPTFTIELFWFFKPFHVLEFSVFRECNTVHCFTDLQFNR